MKRKKPEVGEIIQINHRPTFGAGGDNWVDAEIEALLDTQFTCIFDNSFGRVMFMFYHDQGDSWRFKQ